MYTNKSRHGVTLDQALTIILLGLTMLFAISTIVSNSVDDLFNTGFATAFFKQMIKHEVCAPFWALVFSGKLILLETRLKKWLKKMVHNK